MQAKFEPDLSRAFEILEEMLGDPERPTRAVELILEYGIGKRVIVQDERVPDDLAWLNLVAGDS